MIGEPLDPYGNPAVNYQGTVTFSTSDIDLGIAPPADYTFTSADAGVHTFINAFEDEGALFEPYRTRTL